MNTEESTPNGRRYPRCDLGLLHRLIGDPEMTRYLGGPEADDKIRVRHERYPAIGDTGRMLVIVAERDRTSAGYWARTIDEGSTIWETGWSVLPAFQGQDIATCGTALAIERARDEDRYRFMDAYPSTENTASNAICRKLGFTFLETQEFEYPPGNRMRCNDWRLDLFPSRE
ncbi:MAG: GNAT family N-acetyltransferase [Thermomicrobiales bacterium]